MELGGREKKKKEKPKYSLENTGNQESCVSSRYLENGYAFLFSNLSSTPPGFGWFIWACPVNLG